MTNSNFDPAWMISVIKEAAASDSFLQKHPSLTELLVRELPRCITLSTKVNGKNVNFQFVGREAWQFKKSINILGAEADFYIDIMQDDSIGAIEVWYRSE